MNINFAPPPVQPPVGIVDPNEIARREAIARALQEQAAGMQDIQSPWQGVNQVAQAVVGGLGEQRASQEKAANQKALIEAISGTSDGSPLSQDKLAMVMALSPELGMSMMQDQQGQAEEAANRQKAAEALSQMGMNEQAQAVMSGALSLDDASNMLMKGWEKPAGPEYAPLSQEEVQQLGLPPGSYQRGANGKIDAIGGGGVTVNTGDNSSAFGKKADETAAVRMSDYVTGGNDAANFTGDLMTLADLGKQINTGKSAQIMAALGPYAEALGANIEGLDEAQAFNAIVARMAPQMRMPGSGASSDFDARQFLMSLPSLGNDPEGNQIIIQTFQAIQDRKMAAAQIAQQALAGQITWQEADKQIAGLGDPYTAFNEFKNRRKGGADASVDDLVNKYLTAP